MLGIGSLLSSVTEGISSYVSNKQKITQAKVEGELKVIQAKAEEKVAISKSKMKMAQSGQTQDYNLDRIAMEEMKNSYLDEALLAVFLAPIFHAYWVAGGFAGLVIVPVWYLSLVIGMVVVKYGMRGMLKDYLNGKHKQLLGGK